jgi:site-specific recombinase XerD
LSEHGVDPLVIAEILGHSGLGTVQTHIEITSGRQRDAYSAAGDITRGSPPRP